MCIRRSLTLLTSVLTAREDDLPDQLDYSQLAGTAASRLQQHADSLPSNTESPSWADPAASDSLVTDESARQAALLLDVRLFCPRYAAALLHLRACCDLCR